MWPVAHPRQTMNSVNIHTEPRFAPTGRPLLVMMALGLTISLLAAGCGSGGSAPPVAPTGRATFVIRWPATTRLIPAGTQSIQIVISRAGAPVTNGTAIIAAPSGSQTTTQKTLNGLPVGTFVATATAYPQPNAQGVALATGSAPIQILQNMNTTITVDMVSTIDHLNIVTIAPGTTSLVTNQVIQIIATAYDASGDVVPIGAGTLSWSVDKAGVASVTPVVDASGKATAVATVKAGATAGIATISVIYQEADATGVITTRTGTMQVTVASPSGIAGARFAYVANSGANTISVYLVDPNTGALTASGSPQPAGAQPQSVVVDTTGRYVYAANAGSANISAYVVDSVTGQLTPLAAFTGNPFAAGNQPVALSVAPQGTFLYAVNKSDGTVSLYNIDLNNGAIIPAANPVSTSGAVAGVSPVAIAIDPTGYFVYVANSASTKSAAGSISPFSADATNGALTLISDPAPTGGSGTSSLAIAGSANLLFAANTLSNTISVFSFDGGTTGTGALTLLSSNTSTGLQPSSLAVIGSYLYAANRGSNTIQAYSFSNSGSLAVAGSPLSTGAGPDALAIDPTGRFLYVTNSTDGTVGVYAINHTTGGLTAVPGTLAQTGAGPAFITVAAGSSGGASIGAQ